MQIVGAWWPCDDGVVRPVVGCLVLGSAGQNHPERFLIDSGADRTVLSAELLGKLQLSGQAPPSGFALAGISGTSPIVVVTTVLELAHGGGLPARVSGQFAAFTELCHEHPPRDLSPRPSYGPVLAKRGTSRAGWR